MNKAWIVDDDQVEVYLTKPVAQKEMEKAMQKALGANGKH